MQIVLRVVYYFAFESVGELGVGDAAVGDGTVDGEEADTLVADYWIFCERVCGKRV